MFISEHSFRLFLRDVCAMANVALTGEIEYLFREYIKLIEFIGVGDDAPDEDTAFYERMSMLALTSGKVLAAPAHLRLQDLNSARMKVGFPTIPIPDETLPQEVDAPEEVTPPIGDGVPEAESQCDTDPCPEEPTDEGSSAEEAPYIDGTQMHDNNIIMDMYLPVAEFKEQYSVKQRKGSKKIVRQLKAVSRNKFREFDDNPDWKKLSGDITMARLGEDAYKKRRLLRGAKTIHTGANVVDGIKQLDGFLHRRAVERIPLAIIRDGLPNIKTCLTKGEQLILMRYGTYVPRWRPNVKFKRAMALLLE